MNKCVYVCVCVLQVVGLYRLCGSAAVKKELRDAFERDSAAVALSEELYPDINVITGPSHNASVSTFHYPHLTPYLRYLLLLTKEVKECESSELECLN